MSTDGAEHPPVLRPGDRFPDIDLRDHLVVVSVDASEVQSAFRAGLGARSCFLSDAERRWIGPLGLHEATDRTHAPYLPTALTLFPDLTIHAAYHGHWYWGRATMQELRLDMR